LELQAAGGNRWMYLQLVTSYLSLGTYIPMIGLVVRADCRRYFGADYNTEARCSPQSMGLSPNKVQEHVCNAHQPCIYLGGPSGPHHLCSTTVYNPYPLDTPFRSPTVSSDYFYYYHESYTFYDSTSHLF
jgi:hypothetical protein